jgi:hypothetical protein
MTSIEAQSSPSPSLASDVESTNQSPPIPSTESARTNQDAGMPLPPERRFDTLDALKEYAQTWARDHGYAASVIRSKFNKSGTYKKYIIGCICATNHRDRIKGQRRRQKSTFKTNCNASFFGIEDAIGYTLKHRPDPIYSTHNHNPSTSTNMHWQHRQLNPRGCKSYLYNTWLEPWREKFVSFWVD